MVAGLFVGAVLCVAADPVPPGMPEPHRDALARYGAAVWNLRRERLLTAAKQLETAAKGDPEATDPLRELAKLHAQLGRDPEAIRVARRVVDRDPADHDTAALLARLLADAGETQEAVAAAKLAVGSAGLADRPEKAVRIYREMAALCERAGDLAAAESALRKAVGVVTEGRAEAIRTAALTPKEADTEAADCLERLGHVLVKRSKFDPAAEAFGAAAKLCADPKRVNDPFGAARLGWNLSGALQAKGDSAAALKHLQDFLRLRPSVPEPYQRLADLLRAAGRAEQVVPALREYAAADEPNRALAAVLAAELASAPATRREADERFAALTSYGPQNREVDPRTIAVVVRAHLRTGRAAEILADLDRTFALLEDKKKDQVAASTDAAKRFAADKARAVAAALRDHPKGVEALLAAAGDGPGAGPARASGTCYFLGTLAARHHKLDLAEYHFRLAALGAPKEARIDALAALISVLHRARRPDKIERVCRDAMEADAIQVFHNFHLARALAEQGKVDEALDAADKCILQASTTDRFTVRLRKHEVLITLGKWAEAIDYGKKLLDECDAPADRRRARYALAGAYWAAEKPREAEALLRAMLDDDGDDAAACNDLGYHLAEQGRNLDEAERLVRHAILLDRIEHRKTGSAEDGSAAYRDSLGWVLFRRGKLAEARAELEAALALPDGATDPVPWDHLGDVLFRSGDKTGAKAAWGKARELYEADGRRASRGRLDEVKRKLARVPQ